MTFETSLFDDDAHIWCLFGRKMKMILLHSVGKCGINFLKYEHL